MKKTKIPAIWAIFAAFSLVAAGAIYWVTDEKTTALRGDLFTLGRRLSEQPHPGDKASTQEAAQQDSLRLARDRARQFREGLVREEAVAPLLQELTEHGWRHDEAQPTRNTEYVARDFVFTHERCGIDDWPNVRTAVQLLSTHPGVRIKAMTIEANADESRPMFNKLEMHAVIYLRASGTAPAVAAK